MPSCNIETPEYIQHNVSNLVNTFGDISVLSISSMSEWNRIFYSQFVVSDDLNGFNNSNYGTKDNHYQKSDLNLDLSSSISSFSSTSSECEETFEKCVFLKNDGYVDNVPEDKNNFVRFDSFNDAFDDSRPHNIPDISDISHTPNIHLNINSDDDKFCDSRNHDDCDIFSQVVFNEGNFNENSKLPNILCKNIPKFLDETNELEKSDKLDRSDKCRLKSSVQKRKTRDLNNLPIVKKEEVYFRKS